jgi:hypothetical protein
MTAGRVVPRFSAVRCSGAQPALSWSMTKRSFGLAAVDLIARRDFAIAFIDLDLADVHGRQVIRAARRMTASSARDCLCC